MIKGDKYGVVESILLKTSSDFLIEQPKPQIPQPDMMQIDEPKKAKIEKDVNLESSNSIGHKQIKDGILV